MTVIDLLSTLSAKLRECAHLVELLTRNGLLEVELIVGFGRCAILVLLLPYIIQWNATQLF